MNGIIYYDGRTLENKIIELKLKLKDSAEEEKNFIEQDIKKFEYGLKGEKKIMCELKNSHIPMYILHDLNIQYKDYKAQIDFIIITPKNCYVLECKNLYGNIFIDGDDNFYRIYNNEKTIISNPIIQLERHIEIIKEFVYNQKGFIGKYFTNFAFHSYYKGAVVLTNELTKIKFKKVTSKLKNKVIRLDKILEYIKHQERKTHGDADTLNDMKDFADKILSLLVKVPINDEVNETLIDFDKDMYNLDIILKNKLNKFRFNKAKSLKYKPYFIFNDKTLNDLVLKKPSNIEELKKVYGISDIKIKKYGKDILKIINN